ncbi:Long-chain-fatty-acid--CoA ligase [Entamoeba marina]
MVLLPLGVIVFVCILFLFVLYNIRPKSYPPEVEGSWVGTSKFGETKVLRGFKAIPQVLDYNPQQVETFDDVVSLMLLRNKQKYVGYRNIEKEILVGKIISNVNGKEVVKNIYQYQLSKYHWISSNEYYHLINRLSNGIRSIGFKKGDKIGIFCETRYEWLAFVLACCRQGIVVVTAYATLGKESVKMALEETNVKGVLVSKETFLKLEGIGLNKDIIIIQTDSNSRYNGNYLTFKQLSCSEESKNYSKVSPTDLALIMYTSGTSKEPKGVLIEQKQLLLLSFAYNNILNLKDEETVICYLPLAHIFEICIEICLLMNFSSIGYANTRTLTTTNIINCQSDLKELNPTAMIGVPTVFNKVRKGILDKISNSSFIKRQTFSFALQIKQLIYIDYELRPPLLFQPLLYFIDGLIFNPLKRMLIGDNLHLIVVGGSALAPQLQQFLSCIFPNVDVLQGFGMTELSGASCAMPPKDATTSSIGVLLPMYEAKLRDIPELNYFTTNNPPQGELMFRGPPVCKGYFNRPEDDKISFTDDGWFCTGDVAMITNNNHICIIDRKKNIVKQSCGEYVSLEFVESCYSSLKIVDMVCVFADSFHDFVVALIIPNITIIKELSNGPIQDVIINPVVLKKIKRMLKEGEVELNERQKIKHFKLILDEWTPENGMLTAAFKLKRQPIYNTYKQSIEQLFECN